MKISLVGVSYETKKEALGSGYFFNVYEVIASPSQGSFVAKLLKDEFREDYQEDCERGSRKQQMLNSSGLFPKVEAFGKCRIDNKTNGWVVIEEHVTGRDLAHLMIEKNKKMDQGSLDNLFKQLAYAVYVLHGEGILHRDLHQGNVKVDDNDRIVVVDFNIAHDDIGGQGASASLADEVSGLNRDPAATEHGDMTKKSDVFALGVLFAEMMIGKRATDFIGRPTFEKGNLLECFIKEANKKKQELLDYQISLVTRMLDRLPSNRPDAAGVLQALETRQYRERAQRFRLRNSRDRSFGFVRREDDLIELFIRKVDIDCLALPIRGEIYLMLFHPKNKSLRNEDTSMSWRMLVVPKRFVVDDKQILLFASLSVPNLPGVFDYVISAIESVGDYNVHSINVTKSFRDKAGTIMHLAIGQLKKKPTDIASYLDPLERHLRRCLFVQLFDYFQKNKWMKEWKQWLAHIDHEQQNAIELSATFRKEFRGWLVRRYTAQGAVASTEYRDAANERYAAIRLFDGQSDPEAIDYFKRVLKNKEFALMKVVPDQEHRDLVLQIFHDRGYFLVCLHIRCLLPDNKSPRFIGRFLRKLDEALKSRSGQERWNIERIETSDGLTKSLTGDIRHSIRMTIHIGREVASDFDLEPEKKRIISQLETHLHRQGARSIEAFAIPLFGKSRFVDPKRLLQFASNS